MKDVNKTKEQLIGELQEMRRHLAEFEAPATKGKRARGEEKYFRDLAFLSRTAIGFLKLSPKEDIYEFIGRQLKELVGNSIIIVNSFDAASDSVCVRAALGFGASMGAVIRVLGRHPLGMSLKINDEARLGLGSGKLVKIPGGLYEFCFRRIPRTMCRAIEKLLGVGDIYAMGFAWKGNLFGNASILTHKGTALVDQSLIEAFICQASIALQRRHAEQALQKAHDELEIQVEGRTKELAKANEQLRAEIGERTWAEQGMEQAAKEWRATFDAISDLISIHDEDFKIVRVNKAFAHTFKMKPKEIIGKTCYELMHGAKEPWPDCPQRQVLDTRKPSRKEFFNRHLGIYVEMVCSPIFKERGEVTGAVHITRDITERKRAEQQSKKLQEYLQLQVDRMPIGLIVWDREFRVQSWNPAAEKIFGFTAGEAIGKHPYDLIVPNKVQPHVNDIWRRLLEGNTTAHSVNQNITKYGSTIICDWSNTPLKEVDGTVVGVLSMVQDITEQKRAEEALRDSEERHRAVLESARDAIISINNSGSIISWNRGAQSVFGYSEDEMLGKAVTVLIPQQFRDSYRRTLEQSRPMERPHFAGQTYEFLGLRKDDNEFMAELSLATWSTGKGTFHTAVVRDVTERKRMEEQLIVADRLASIGELASGIAHELNNPLTSVIGFCELLLAKKDVSEDIKKDLRIINKNAQRTAGIVQNLTTFARKHPQEMYMVNMNNLIRTVLELRAYEQRVSNIQVKTHFANNLPEISADGFQLQQVFLNIIINAEYFMTEAHGKGILTITTERRGNFIRTSIADDGPGIDKKNLDHLFDPFFTTKEVGKGTGLGLSICHGIVNAHSGKIYAESKMGKGTTFIVELPIKQVASGVEQ